VLIATWRLANTPTLLERAAVQTEKH
jgi:hypothetical protein